MTSPQPRPSRFIARQLALGFSTVSVIAVAMCTVLMWTIDDVSRLVADMHEQERSVRIGLDLATAVRDQSLSIARTIAAADDSQLASYEESRQQVRTRIQEMAAEVPAREAWRLQILGEVTQRLHDVFQQQLVPAVRRGDLTEARRAHDIITALGRRASEQADGLALAVDSKMAAAHRKATSSTRLGLVSGGLCSLLLLALSAGFTFRIRRAILAPLATLTASVRRYGAGDFTSRIGQVGEGEILELAAAFDSMADELNSREKKLVQQERLAAIGQLATGVAHELNNPIGIIRGYLKTMSPDEDAETLKGELAILDEEAAQCQRIASDLLSYSRTADLDFERADMAELLAETVRRFRESPEGVRVSVVLEADEQHTPMDRARVRQVLLNLLHNAALASSPASVVEVRGIATKDSYQIDVMDHGVGIPAGEHHRVFEPFFSKRPGGSGLGLSVVAGIVHAHGGTVEALDGPDGGALFRVILPQVRPRSAHEPETPEVTQ